MGRKPIQLLGFSMLTIIFIIMGFGYDKITSTVAGTKAFLFLYCLANLCVSLWTFLLIL